MSGPGILRKVDAVTVRVPDIDAGIQFYVDVLGHRVKWRNDAIGQAGLELPDGDSEIVLTTEHGYEPNWLVESVDDAIEVFARTAVRSSPSRSTSPSAALASSSTPSAMRSSCST